MTAGQRVALALACGLGLLLVAAPASGARKKRQPTLIPASMPAWVQEAIARPQPETDEDLVWLAEEQIVEPLAEGGVAETYRVAAKLLRPRGLGVINSHALYYTQGDRIDQIEAWTLTPDETVRRSDPEDDVRDLPAINELGFNDTRYRVVQAPGVVVGSVVAFEHRIVRQLDPGAEEFVFGDAQRPTAFSRFVFKLPQGWGYETAVLRGESLEVEQQPDGEIYTVHHLEPIKREALAPPVRDRLPVVWVHWWSPDGKRGYRDWDAVGRWFRALSEPTLNQAGEAAQLAEKFRPANTEQLLDALARAFAFAARDVRYVAIDVGVGLGAGYTPAPPAQVCANRYGDCKDKAFLLRAMAQAWGVSTYPVIVRTSHVGEVVPGVPTPGQFNHCIAAVRLPDGLGDELWSTLQVDGLGRLVFLDATVREGSPWALPEGDQGTLALLVHGDGAELIRLPVQPPDAGTTRRRIEAEIDEQGQAVRATLVEQWSGTQAAMVRYYYGGMSESEHRSKLLEDLQGRFPGASVAGYEVRGLDDVHQPVIETVQIEGARLAKRVGDLLIVEPGRLGFGVVRQDLPDEERTAWLDLGLPRQEELQVSIRIPPGWKPEALRQGSRIGSEDLAADVEWSADEGRIGYRRTVRLQRTKIPPEDYAEFRQLLREISIEDRQAVVLVRD